MKKFLPILTLCLAMAGCTSTKPTGSSQADASLEGNYWALIEVMGKPVVTPADAREIHVLFAADKKSLSGYGGCNNLIGSYIIDQPGRIKCTVGATLMACPGERMETEAKLFGVLNTTDSYAITGDTLQLYKARMAPLAKLKKRVTSR